MNPYMCPCLFFLYMFHSKYSGTGNDECMALGLTIETLQPSKPKTTH